VRFDELLDRWRSWSAEEALVFGGKSYSYADLERQRAAWIDVIGAKAIRPGDVVGLKADYSFAGIALFLALLANRNVVALVPPAATDDTIYLRDGQVQSVFRFSGETWDWEPTGPTGNHPLLVSLRESNAAGFIIFSSGSTGTPKASLHKLETFLTKFDRANKRLRTLAFLRFDHIAGIDTLFYALASGGSLILPTRRDTQYLCDLIQERRVEVLPASPTLLRLLCLSQVGAPRDLSSLKIVTYGSEPMDQGTLERMKTITPNARLIQKYGMSELGAPSSRSKGDDSLWLKLNSDRFQIKVVNDILWVKTETAMLGYLNAPNPFDADGWFCTEDSVEVDGDWLRILGRQSDIIIVGGEKVYPQEVEAVILEMDNIEDVAVRGEPHSIVGQIIVARVNLKEPRDEKMVLKDIRQHCRTKLPSYKIPIKVEMTQEPLTSSRQKKVRK
jgi:acyl-CoA synthetase (AMP-forming)/AMP-acid ligase II